MKRIEQHTRHTGALVKEYFRRSYIWIILLLIYIPIFIVILWSFNTPGRHGLYDPVFGGFTLSEYGALFTAQGFWGTFLDTVIIAASAGLISVVVATLAAYGMWRNTKVINRVTAGLSNVSMVTPDIITAISMSFLLAAVLIPLGLKPGFTTAILSNTSYGVAYSLFIIYPRITKMNRFVIDASKDLGNNGFRTFTKIILPFIMPAVVSAFALTFAWSFDDFIITRIALGNNLNISTVSIDLYLSAYRGIKAYYFAFGALLIIIILISAFSYSIYRISKDRRKAKK